VRHRLKGAGRTYIVLKYVTERGLLMGYQWGTLQNKPGSIFYVAALTGVCASAQPGAILSLMSVRLGIIPIKRRMYENEVKISRGLRFSTSHGILP
jgi:hypothetical protein